MKSLLLLFSFLTERQAAEFMVEASKQNDSEYLARILHDNFNEYPDKLLAEAFDWKLTAQGSEYWNAIWLIITSAR
jgi:hypothetical protein